MTRARKLILGAALLLAAAGGLVEHRFVRRQQVQLDVHQEEMARLEAASRGERQRLASIQAEHDAVEREMTLARAAAADAEACSTMKLWANRIVLLRKLLEEIPAQSLPELRLLTPTDWVRVVRTKELDSAANIRSAFASLRLTARRKMAEKLQEALKAFTAASGGELPADIGNLAPYLSAPADREMLQRYSLLRSGRIGDGNEYLIKEAAVGDVVLSVALQTWNMSNNSDWEPSSGGETAALARAMTALESAFEQFDTAGEKVTAQAFKWDAFRELAERLAPQMDAIFGDKLGEEIKGAVKRFSAERNGAVPANFGELAPYFTNFEQLITFARPIIAELEYMRDHLGQRHTDPEQLRRYLEKPLDQMKILRDLKLTVSGDNVTMNYSIGSDSK